MDSTRFDHLTRTLSSRRTALGGLLGGSLAALLGLTGPEDGAAHNALPRCRAIKNATRRAACLRRAKAHRSWHQRTTCVPQALALTCVGRCGVYTNNCNQATACPCPTGKTCIGNGSCAQQTCSTCPAGCGCGYPSVEGPSQCIKFGLTCTDLAQPCAGSTECPVGWHCQPVNCGPGGATVNRCAQLCPN